MRKWIMIVGMVIACGSGASAQCSICTKTAMQQGEKPAAALNSAIVYLMLAPFAVAGYVGYRWWRNEGKSI